MKPSKEIFRGKIVKNCTEEEIKESIRLQYLKCIATIGHTKPDADILEIAIMIVIDDLITHYPYLHLTEMEVIFHKGIRRELNDFTIFAPVEVYKWFKTWYESPERAKLRAEFMAEQKNLLPPKQETPPKVDYEKWLQDALILHRSKKSQLVGLHLLYDYLVASNRIKHHWEHFRKLGKARMENMLLAGKTSQPLKLREEIGKADKATDGMIKAVCIELAMEEFFNE